MARLLTKKYGKPAKVTPMVWVNDYGLRQNYNDYDWSRAGEPRVFFSGLDANKAGRVTIKSPSLASQQAAQEQTRQKRELKL